MNRRHCFALLALVLMAVGLVGCAAAEQENARNSFVEAEEENALPNASDETGGEAVEDWPRGPGSYAVDDNGAMVTVDMPADVSRPNSVKVTYIANSGYLVESSDNKILIDALFTRSSAPYSAPSTDMCKEIINGDAPFDNVEALFITHAHGDHFSPSLVKKFLERNEDRYVVCSDITSRELANAFGADEYQRYADRIRDTTPEIYSSIDSNVGDLKFTIIRLRHSGASESNKNLGYLVSMNGINVLHTGDNDGNIADGQGTNGIEEYSKLNMDNERIDIAIVNRGMFWEETSPGIEVVREYIKPRVAILAHLSRNDAQGELSQVLGVLSENRDEIPNVVKLENSLDSTLFEF